MPLKCHGMPVLLLVAAGVRLALIAWAEWQDRHLAVPYTDVDYHVFSDAAAFVAQGVHMHACSVHLSPAPCKLCCNLRCKLSRRRFDCRAPCAEQHGSAAMLAHIACLHLLSRTRSAG